jgi:hypothetical protein
MANTNTAMGGRDRWATVACWAMIVTSSMFMILEIMEASGRITASALEPGIYEIYIAVSLLQTAGFLASVVFVAMWIYRSHANLQDAGFEGLEFKPGWAVGWYFIPFANLFKPFQAMRELWNRSMLQDDSFGGEAPSEVKLWWGLWIVGNIVGNVSTRMVWSGEESIMAPAAAIGAVSSAILIACAWYLLGLIKQISAAQENGLHVPEVFS